MLSAVSSAVTVPGLLKFKDKSMGIKKGIPTLIIAASSLDDIVAITGFTIMFTITLSKGDNIWLLFLKGILEPVGGIALGSLCGVILWVLPSSLSTSATTVYYHVILLCLMGFTGMFLSHRLDVAGIGPMMCLVMAFVASLDWEKHVLQLEKIERVIDVMWITLEPFLFSLMGAELSLRTLKSNIGFTILSILISLAFRILTVMVVCIGGGFLFKEKIFITVSWIPKATVQAAVGSQALDYVVANGLSEDLKSHAEKILAAAVLSILLTAPAGAALIDILGPFCLSDDSESESKDVEKKTSSDQNVKK
ncbi:hypothetical protein TNCT_195941 [Trichonephila clavata]|uniref:Cation/H+ exchanger transmembrane domain-containing protein n=1 Tax=Trichonephila clavata TaxID=2740835 RepID=A0A8X6LVF6_TRICU|nr:hypothetical protein TNCT_195941 [Trichonephila clavata]